mgnify:CR=1 FL=1
MKGHEVDLCGQHLYLLLNGQALFDIYDKFGTKGFITDPLKDNNKAGFEAMTVKFVRVEQPDPTIFVEPAEPQVVTYNL